MTMAEKKDKLIKHATVILAGSFVGNVLSYLFHLVMARMLGPADYGSLVALMALIVVLNVPLTTVQTILTKEIAVLNARNENGKAKTLFLRYIKILGILGAIALFALLALSGIIMNFLHLNSITPVFLLSLITASTVFLVVINGALNGLQKFWGLNFSIVGTGAFKLGIAAALVGFGLGISGALSGVLAATIISTLIGSLFLKSLLKEKAEKASVRDSLKYSGFVLIALICINAFINLDVIIVKHLFSSHDAGLYGALSETGKIIFFLTSAITLVLLPKASEAHSLGDLKAHKRILYKTLLIVALPSFAISAAYFAMPQFFISLLFGKQYLQAASSLGLFAIAISFYSLINVLVMYFISISRKKFVIAMAAFVVLEVALFFTFHDSLQSIVTILLALMTVLFVSLFIYSLIDRKAD